MATKPISEYNEVDCLRAIVVAADSSVNTAQMQETQCLKWIVSNLDPSANVGSMQELSCMKRWVSHLDSTVNVGSMQEVQCLRWLVTHFRDGAGGRYVSTMNELECLRELVTTATGGGAAPDPLAGLTLWRRVQTHNGDKVPLGIYQDEACTILADEEGDPVAGLKDDFGSALGIGATQGTGAKRGVMVLDAGGAPYIDFDGVDDSYLLTGADLGGQVTYSALFRNNAATFNSYWSLLDVWDSLLPLSDVAWGYFSQGSAAFQVDQASPAAVNREGVSKTTPFDIAPIDEWLIVTITTDTATDPTSRGIGALYGAGAGYYGAFGLIALIGHEAADTATVQAYLQTLK